MPDPAEYRRCSANVDAVAAIGREPLGNRVAPNIGNLLWLVASPAIRVGDGRPQPRNLPPPPAGPLSGPCNRNRFWNARDQVRPRQARIEDRAERLLRRIAPRRSVTFPSV